jgi:PAS domain S-box-containing protein
MSDAVSDDGSAPLAPARQRRLGYSAAVAVLLLSLVLVWGAWHTARQNELRLAEAQFRTSAGKLVELVEMQLSGFELTARGGVSLFAAVQWPSPQHWRSYVGELSLHSRFSSVTGLGFAAYVDPGGLANLQLLMRDTHQGNYQIQPRGRRPEYGPIVYLQPQTPENLAAVGFDMFSEPTRRAAMRAAMESGQPRLSGRVRLVQDRERDVAGMLMYVPVYQGALTPSSPAARRAAMKGWVYMPFRVAQMVESATAPARGTERMRIVDVTEPRHVVLYEDVGIDDDSTFGQSLTVKLYGRSWRFDVFSGPTAAAAPGLASLNWLLAAGVVASLSLFALMWMLASTQSRAQRLAVAMTESFRRSEQRFRNAMRYSAIGKALLDTRGTILEANPAFARIVGRPADALVGIPLDMLLDGTSTPLESGSMQRLEDGAGEAVRTTRTLRRSDGATRHVELTFAPVPGDPDRDIARLVQVDDVTERVVAEEAVRALNRTLEARVAARTRELSEANRELEAFAYSVSHDLRAPLRGIEGFSRILSERYAGALDATGRDYLERVRKATGRMGELIDALLKLSRIGRSGLKVEDVDLSALSEEVLAGLADADPARSVELRVHPGLRASGDRALLHNLLENLLGNAWKFTRLAADPWIEVGARVDSDGRTWFHVRDNGAGFAPEYVNKLFKPFQRLHSQDDYAGHGIGLASVKRIVERHGGDISAEGATDGGATFRFTLQPAPDRAGS